MEGPEHAMRCLICGRPSLPGAKLCLDCKAARKRAFDATVTQPLLAAAGAGRVAAAPLRLFKPSQLVPDVARRAAKMALAAQAQSKIASESPPGRAGRWPIVVGAIGIVVVVVVAVIASAGHWSGASKSDTFAAVPIERPAAPDSPAAALIVRSSTPGATAAGAAETVPVAANPAGVLPPAAATKADAAPRPSARRRPEAPIVLPPPEPSPAPVVAIERPPPPVVREVPRPDRWQLMNEAIARCPRDDTPGRFSCEQRLRTQYCEGLWGQVAQCASIPYTDHGQ
jgi:hypothetical protein